MKSINMSLKCIFTWQYLITIGAGVTRGDKMLCFNMTKYVALILRFMRTELAFPEN